jgi:hypothetical protein
VIYIAYALFAFGCLVSLTNFYLSFLRYPLYRFRGEIDDNFQWSSGLPMIGSLLIVVSIFSVAEVPWLFWGGVLCAILDTGGVHWFAGIMLYLSARDDT